MEACSAGNILMIEIRFYDDRPPLVVYHNDKKKDKA
jgi:hypothetical protein